MKVLLFPTGTHLFSHLRLKHHVLPEPTSLYTQEFIYRCIIYFNILFQLRLLPPHECACCETHADGGWNLSQARFTRLLTQGPLSLIHTLHIALPTRLNSLVHQSSTVPGKHALSKILSINTCWVAFQSTFSDIKLLRAPSFLIFFIQLFRKSATTLTLCSFERLSQCQISYGYLVEINLLW